MPFVIVSAHGQVCAVADTVHDAQVAAVPVSVHEMVPLVAVVVAVRVTAALER